MPRERGVARKRAGAIPSRSAEISVANMQDVPDAESQLKLKIAA